MSLIQLPEFVKELVQVPNFDTSTPDYVKLPEKPYIDFVYEPRVRHNHTAFIGGSIGHTLAFAEDVRDFQTEEDNVCFMTPYYATLEPKIRNTLEPIVQITPNIATFVKTWSPLYQDYYTFRVIFKKDIQPVNMAMLAQVYGAAYHTMYILDSPRSEHERERLSKTTEYPSGFYTQDEFISVEFDRPTVHSFNTGKSIVYEFEVFNE
jgi:hypothetical protein